MDYLDPKKQFRHSVIMIVGYVVVAIAIAIATLILVYQAYGFGLGQHGSIIQNGLIFISSQPSSAQVDINGVNKAQTSTRILMPAGIYQVKLSRSGYRDWQRVIDVQGGSVKHYDYPFLFPTSLKTTKLQDYAAAPALASQSPDRRWLVVQQPVATITFDVYDLKNAAKAPTVISLPVGLASKATNGDSWQALEWADDNQHLLMRHDYSGKSEYLLIDRQNVDQSVNLNNTLSINPSKLGFRNKKYDQYYIYNSATASLQTASLGAPVATALIDHVAAYKTYNTDSVLFITDSDAPIGRVLLKLLAGNQIYTIRSFPAASSYLLDLANYSGTLYVAASAVSENKVYIYKDPIGQLKAQPTHSAVPIQVLHVNDPNYLSFSTVYQFIVAEHGAQFGVYDIENATGYNYTMTSALDTPQTHATWMDDGRLSYVSSGKLMVFDFDSTNQQTLLPVSSNYLPFFSPDYKYLYDFSSSPTQPAVLEQTSLVVP